MNHSRKFKSFISVTLVISFILNMCFSSLGGTKFSIFDLMGFGNEDSLNYIEEVEVEDNLIDEGMFYLPYKHYEVNEDNENRKFYFKVKRNLPNDKEEKVKLTFLDMTSKYGRDYKARVYGSGIFKEKVNSIKDSKNIPELMNEDGMTEYNTSDSIINGEFDEEFEGFQMKKNLTELLMILM